MADVQLALFLMSGLSEIALLDWRNRFFIAHLILAGERASETDSSWQRQVEANGNVRKLDSHWVYCRKALAWGKNQNAEGTRKISSRMREKDYLERRRRKKSGRDWMSEEGSLLEEEKRGREEKKDEMGRRSVQRHSCNWHNNAIPCPALIGFVKFTDPEPPRRSAIRYYSISYPCAIHLSSSSKPLLSIAESMNLADRPRFVLINRYTYRIPHSSCHLQSRSSAVSDTARCASIEARRLP